MFNNFYLKMFDSNFDTKMKFDKKSVNKNFP